MAIRISKEDLGIAAAKATASGFDWMQFLNMPIVQTVFGRIVDRYVPAKQAESASKGSLPEPASRVEVQYQKGPAVGSDDIMDFLKSFLEMQDDNKPCSELKKEFKEKEPILKRTLQVMGYK